MGKIGAIFLALIMLFLLIGPFRDPILDGIKGWRSSATTQTASVTPTAGSANVTLAHDLYQAVITSVNTITSNVSAAPATAGYTETTRVLLVAGLDPGLQTLTINYAAETDDQTMRIVGPFVAFFIFFGMAGLIVWSALTGKKGRR